MASDRTAADRAKPLALAALCAVILAALLLGGCASAPPPRPERVSALANGSFPKKVLVLPAHISSHEMSAGGVVEEVKAWSDQSTANVDQDLQRYARSRPNLALVPMPTLSEAEQQTLEQHLALYNLVGTTAYVYSSSTDEAWKHKRTHFDYTVGDGLRFLKERSGADAALIVSGQDYISTSGRKGLAVAAAMFGVVMELGRSYLLAGLVDLDTGNILWMNFEFSYAGADLRKPGDSAKMVKGLFEEFPGGPRKP